jgi:hypothetical protein
MIGFQANNLNRVFLEFLPLIIGSVRDEAAELALLELVNDKRRTAKLACLTPKLISNKSYSFTDVFEWSAFEKTIMKELMNPKTQSISIKALRKLGRKVIECAFSQEQVKPGLLLNGGASVAYHREVSIDLVGLQGIRAIRVKEDDGEFSSWKPYRQDGVYTLKGGDGEHLVTVEYRTEADSIQHVSDAIQFVGEACWPARVEKQVVRSTVEKPGVIPPVPLVFPVLGGVQWSDTWGAPRGGGSRKHEGQDLMAPKMTFVLAATEGVFYGTNLLAPDGYQTHYLHLNNDTPGTDDGKGGNRYYYAPGVYLGMRVYAGQHIAYVGDSGNAENVGSHLHFELQHPQYGVYNAAESLRIARILNKPQYKIDLLEFLPKRDQQRIDCRVETITQKGFLATIAAKIDQFGNAVPSTKLETMFIEFGEEWQIVREHDFVAVITSSINAPFGAERLRIIRRARRML